MVIRRLAVAGSRACFPPPFPGVQLHGFQVLVGVTVVRVAGRHRSGPGEESQAVALSCQALGDFKGT